MPTRPDETDDPPRVVTDHEVPEHWMEDDEVEQTEFLYSARHPDDWVAPRVFNTLLAAHRWGKEKYGERFRGVIQSPNQVEFAVLVKGPRG